MNPRQLTDALRPGTTFWGKGPPGLAGFAWPEAGEGNLECAFCGSPIAAQTASGNLLLCSRCQEGVGPSDSAATCVEYGGGD
jgi:hypothetical protein